MKSSKKKEEPPELPTKQEGAGIQLNIALPKVGEQEFDNAYSDGKKVTESSWSDLFLTGVL